MALSKKAIAGAGWAVTGGYVSQLLSFLMFIITSRLVGPAAFGTVAVALALVELGRAISTENVAGNLVARGAYEESAFNAGFVWTMASTIALCLLLIGLAPLLADAFNTPDLRTVLPQISVLLVFYGASRLQEARLVQQMRFRSLAFRTIAAALIGGLTGLFAARAGFGVTALVWQQWSGALVSVALLWTACDWRPRWRFSRETFFSLHRVSLALAPAGLINNVSQLIDGVAAATFGGPTSAGVYNLGKRVRLAMQMALSSGLNRVSLPAFASVRAHPEMLSNAFSEALCVSFLVVFPVFFGLAAISPELIDIFLGPTWEAAAAPMAILLIGGALATATAYGENVLLVLEHRRWIIASRFVLLVVLIIGLMALGRFGPTGIATASLIATMSQLLVCLWLTSKAARFALTNYLGALGRPLALSIVMFATLLVLRQGVELHRLDALPRLFVQVAAGVALYASTTWLFARGNLFAALKTARRPRS
jgi:O-antigen/teichoic acid export membrane protein